MKLSRISACLIAAACAAGCAGTGEVQYGGAVGVASPDLIEVQPGVQVIADADEPIFYSDGAYWMYRDGMWMRSNYYNSGFARVDIDYVPQPIRYIDQPRAYVHYRQHMGRGYARPAPYVRRDEPYRAQGGVMVTPARPVYRQGPGPVIRDDRRNERREERRDDRRDDRRDERRERRRDRD